MPEMRGVWSSYVASIGYDAATNELHVEYKNGKTTVYDAVPADVAGQVLTSMSIGEALHGLVRNRYPYRDKQ